MKLKELANKKILILGLGREGQSTFLFLRKRFPKKILALADKLAFEKLPPKIQREISKDKKLKLHLDKGYLKTIKDYDIIIKSPGIPLKVITPVLKTKPAKLSVKQKRKLARITSQTEIFFEECKGKIIGITGTKGKSTTATLIYKILKARRLPVFLIGNIERPALSYLKEAKKGNIFVYELSSHQLLGLKESPHIAVFLNLFPEHLDYYQTFKDYFEAKKNITLHQKSKDYFIFNADQKELKTLAKKTKAQKIPFSRCSFIGISIPIKSEGGRGNWVFPRIGKQGSRRPTARNRGFLENIARERSERLCSTSGVEQECWIEKEDIIFAVKKKIKPVAQLSVIQTSRSAPCNSFGIKAPQLKEKIMKIKDVPLPGEFNLSNTMAAILVAKIFKVPTKSIVKSIKNFKGLPHRLEFIGTHKGIKFYNDSLATIPEATIEAIETLGKDVQTMLLGGFDRGVSFKNLAQKIWQSNIKTLILFPESGMRIWQEILNQKKAEEKLPSVFLAHDMKEAVEICFQHTRQGKICLLSPASPSFGLFKNYRERGDLFKKYVKHFGRKKRGA